MAKISSYSPTPEDRARWRHVAEEFAKLMREDTQRLIDSGAFCDCETCRVGHGMSVGLTGLFSALLGSRDDTAPAPVQGDADTIMLGIAEFLNGILSDMDRAAKEQGIETEEHHRKFVKALARIHAETNPEAAQALTKSAIADAISKALGVQAVVVEQGLTAEQEALMRKFADEGAKYVMVGPGGVMIPLYEGQTAEGWLKEQGIDVDTDPDIRSVETPQGGYGFEVKKGSATEAKLEAIAKEQAKRIRNKELN